MSDAVNRAKSGHKSHIRVKDKRALLQLESPLSIASVSQLKKELLQKLLSKDVSEIRVDGAAVNSADTASLQLLCSLSSFAKSKNIGFTWTAVSSAIVDAAAMLDLSGTLNLGTANEKMAEVN